MKAGIGVAMISNIILEGEDKDELVERDLSAYFPKMNYGIFVRKGIVSQALPNDFIKLLTEEKLLESQKS